MEVEYKHSFRESIFHFPVLQDIGLTVKTSGPLERTGNFGLVTQHGHFATIFYIMRFLLLKCMRTHTTYKQTVTRNICYHLFIRICTYRQGGTRRKLILIIVQLVNAMLCHGRHNAYMKVKDQVTEDIAQRKDGEIVSLFDLTVIFAQHTTTQVISQVIGNNFLIMGQNTKVWAWPLTVGVEIFGHSKIF